MSESTLILGVDSRQVKDGAKSLDDLAAAGGRAEKSTDALTKASAVLANVARAAAGAFGLYKLASLAQESAMLAARFETMGIVMKVAGNNAGYTAAQMNLYSAALQKSGISMLQSRDALTQLATAQIDLTKAQAIGRAAQDLAVVANTNSSEAMARMIHGIKSGQTEVLRTLGLNVNFEASYKSMAAQLGVNEQALTAQQKTMARTNAVLLESKNYAGIYEESMTTAGKAMSSLARYSENLKIKIGDIFLPALADAVFQYTDALKAANAEMDKLGSARTVANIGESLAGAFRVVYETVVVLAANVGYVFTTIGNEIGGMAAQIAAVLRGDFAGAAQIRKDMIADAVAGRKAIDAFSDRMINHAKVTSATTKVSEEARIATGKAVREKAEAETKAAAATEAAKKASDANQKAITSMIVSLEKESDTYGMTAAQVKIYEAAKLGMTKKELEHAISLIESTAAMEASAQATADVQKAAEQRLDVQRSSVVATFDGNEALREEIAAIGKTREEIALLELAILDKTIAQKQATTATGDALVLLTEEIRLLQERRGLLVDKGAAQAAQAAIDAQTKAAKEAVSEQTKAAEDQWKMIDGFAHDAFDNIFDKGKNVFKELGNAIKKYLLDMLYKMTVQKWMISVGMAGTGASGAAAAATNVSDIGGMASGIQNLWNVGSSAISSVFGSAATGMAAFTSAQMSGAVMATTYTAPAIATLGAEAGAAASGLGALGSAAMTALPYIGAAIAVFSLLKGNKSTPTTSLGHAVTSFSATGVQTGTQSLYGGTSAAVDAQIAAMQTGYMKAAMALGIGTTSQQWGFAMNTGANGQKQMFGLSGGGFEQTETAFSEAEVQLAASRAVFAALQGSELPQYLSRMFDGLTASTMTQQDIDNTLAFAGSVKQMRDALLETRAPLEVLRANVDAGTAAFATSAETFRTDFVAAIDAGINPQVFEQWKALGTAIDQLAAADAEVAAQNAEALVRAAEDMVRYQTTMLDLQAQIVELTGDTAMAEAVLIEQRKLAIAELNASDPTGYLAALTNQLWGLQDAADAAAIAADDAAIAAQAAADAFELITSSLAVALDDARNILRASIDAEKSALQAAYETELATAKARVDAVGESVRKLTDLSSLLKSTVTSMAVGVTRESAQAQLSAALAAARAGGALPSADSLQDAIRTLSQPSESKFGSYFDYMRDFITTSNDIAALAELTDDQLTEQEQTLMLAQDSLEILTLTYDANMLRLDGIWEEATGIHYAVIDVATALANFQAATGAVAAAPQVQGLVNQQIAAVQAAGVDPSTYNAMAVTSVASQLESSIADMYQSILGRTADVSGLSAWASSGLSLSMIESQIAASAEAQARAISVGAQNTMIEAVNAALGVATNIRAYATGSNFIDRDQLAMLHRGETVTPAPFVDRERAAREETNALLSRLLESNNETKAELKAAKAELTAIKSTNYKMWQIDDKHDIEGTPPVRT